MANQNEQQFLNNTRIQLKIYVCKCRQEPVSLAHHRFPSVSAVEKRPGEKTLFMTVLYFIFIFKLTLFKCQYYLRRR